ncbi:hypothetical protein PUN28_006127 [Cardiocondyla obscurior]|uniref:Secreted protein n=1 Tax=Cardiocondyla obscurior TaxID=286306 RepID=A0AAW2GAZ9_9HYME
MPRVGVKFVIWVVLAKRYSRPRRAAALNSGLRSRQLYVLHRMSWVGRTVNAASTRTRRRWAKARCNLVAHLSHQPARPKEVTRTTRLPFPNG